VGPVAKEGVHESWKTSTGAYNEVAVHTY